MKNIVMIAAALSVTVGVAAYAAPGDRVPDPQTGLTAIDWWAARDARVAAEEQRRAAPSVDDGTAGAVNNKRAPFARSVNANGQGTD